MCNLCVLVIKDYTVPKPTNLEEGTPFRAAVDYFGSQKKLAKALGVAPLTISRWVEGGIPLTRAFQIELATGKRVTAKELAPEYFQATDAEDPIFYERRG